MNGSAKNALRAVRHGPRRADQHRTTMAVQATASATNDPTGRSVTLRMNASVSRNFRRASARWSQLERAR
jgi:hypothetical protein